MFKLLTSDFWISIAWALLRTFLAGIVPFVPGLLTAPAQTLPAAASTIGLLLLITVLTSLRGIPDPQDAFWGTVLIARFLRQFGQFFLAGLPAVATLTDLSPSEWYMLLLGALASAVSTAIIYALSVIPTADSVAAVVAAVEDEITAEETDGEDIEEDPDFESESETEPEPGTTSEEK